MNIYFLVWPIGRNAQSVLGLGRELWEEWHLWGGVSMILVVAVHFAYHWGWGKSMAPPIGRWCDLRLPAERA